MSWKVKIHGDKSILAELAQLRTISEWVVTSEGDIFFLESDRFQPDHSEKDVHDRAADLVQSLNGVLRLERRLTEPLTVGAVYKPREDGEHDIYVLAQAACATTTSGMVSATVRRADGTVKTCQGTDPLRDWMNVQSHDKAVAQVLRILAEPPGWDNLYRIFEVVRDDCGGEMPIASHGWATEKKMGLFRRTANSPAAIGQQARHAVQKNAPPKKPMSIREARRLIHGIARQWLNWKVEYDSGSGSRE